MCSPQKSTYYIKTYQRWGREKRMHGTLDRYLSKHVPPLSISRDLSDIIRNELDSSVYMEDAYRLYVG